MFKLVIQDDEGKTTIVPLIRDEITIGRKEGNTIRLTERNVSRRHARILRNNGEVHIEDLGSYNGIRVNNARIAERVSLRVSDQVQIGDYKLYLKAEGAEQTDESRTMPLERVDSQVPTEAMNAVTPTPAMPHAMPQLPAAAQLIGNPNRTLVAIADTDPTGRTIGPATAEAVAALTAAPGGHGKLVVLSSNFAGKEFELSRPQMIIGRTDENDIVINHRSISRNHAKLVREPETGRYTVSDLQSSNGVRVNGQDYGKVELRRGDVIDLGHVRLRFIEAGEDFVFARDAVVTDVPEAGSRRGMLVAILAAIVAVVAGVVVYTMHGSSDKPADGSAPPPNMQSAVVPTSDADEAPTPVEHQTPEVVADAVAQPGSAAARSGGDEKVVYARCTDLFLKKEWQGLDDCATELGALGLKAKAKEFHDQAVQETQNEANASKVRQALRDGNLKEAQTTLRAIGEDSVYAKPTREAFAKAETQVVDEARRKAAGFVNAHDCASLKRLYTQQVAASTERVAAAVGAFKCTAAPVEPPAPKTPPAPGSASVVQSPPPPPATPPPPAAKNGQCDTMNVDEVMLQAAAQYSAGFNKAALAQVLKALACKQEARMYRFAVTYACAAHDLATAKQYFAKVPPAYQPNLEQKCQLEGLNVRGQ
jgi:pSer/pThr/pTyr-binding forkhead associated (FHA) protein